MPNRTNRRDFFKAVAAASIVAAGAPSVSSQRRWRTAVLVGSGLSGLAAAYKLKDAGWKVTIIDGRSRKGGRVFSHTDAATGIVCEVGAEWVGEDHVRLKALCHDFKIPRIN
ncbi:MAG: FAD-dependent oxidoreductase [Pyrinomonadaceae bacterium]